MAKKPLRLCAHAGCGTLTRSVYCDKHKPRYTDTRSAEAEAWHSLYRTALWRKKLRPAQLLREPFCRLCARAGQRVPATDVDHIVPHRGNWDLFVDPNNHQSLCHQCHGRKTAEEMREQAQKK